MAIRRFLALKDHLLKIFLKDKDFKMQIARQKQMGDGKKIWKITTVYDGVSMVCYNEEITIIQLDDSSPIQRHPDFIDVTQNPLYDEESILAGHVKKVNLVIEGSDGVGKSTLVSDLANQGILCQDRAVREITQKMRMEISEDERLASVQNYLRQNKNRKVVFLYLSNEALLMQRVYARGVVSSYDKQTVNFQRLYVETYQKLRENENLFLVDGFLKSRERMVEEIIKIL